MRGRSPGEIPSPSSLTRIDSEPPAILASTTTGAPGVEYLRAFVEGDRVHRQRRQVALDRKDDAIDRSRERIPHLVEHVGHRGRLRRDLRIAVLELCLPQEVPDEALQVGGLPHDRLDRVPRPGIH